MTVMTDAQTGTDAATLPRAERAIGLFVAGPSRFATLKDAVAFARAKSRSPFTRITKVLARSTEAMVASML